MIEAFKKKKPYRVIITTPRHSKEPAGPSSEYRGKAPRGLGVDYFDELEYCARNKGAGK